jgi:predicted nucleic acid-binding Zn ribbon protein
MAEIVPQHSHCQMCGKAIPVTETLCSDDCRQKYYSLVRKRKILVYLMYGLIFAIIIILYLFSNDILG